MIASPEAAPSPALDGLARQERILSLLYANRGAAGLIALRVTQQELAWCGIECVEKIARAFQRFDCSNDWDEFVKAVDDCWYDHTTFDEDGHRNAERAALALALVHPQAVEIARALRIHTHHDRDHGLLIANHAATGATGRQTIEQFYDQDPLAEAIDLGILVALQAGEVNLVLDMAKSGFDVTEGAALAGAKTASDLLRHPDFPREMLNSYMARAINGAYLESIVLCAECGAELPLDPGLYSELLRLSDQMRGDWVKRVAAAITLSPNWRDAWPHGGSGPLAELLECERARASAERLKTRVRPPR